jgi:hypothetical protein
MTDVPAVPPGTANVQVKAPAPFVVSVPLVHVETATPSKTSEESGALTEKPVPETVTVAPVGPWPGLTAMAGVVTVNVPLAVWPPTSVAVTVVPEVLPGTANVQLNIPATFVVR